MKCAIHGIEDAVASCKECGKGLCQQCLHHGHRGLCHECLVEKAKTESKQLYWGLLVTVIAFFAGFYVWYSIFQGFITTALLVGLLTAGAYWGWLFLNRYLFRISDKSRTFGKSLLIYGSYYLLKLALSFLIGLVAGPYEIIRITLGIMKVKKLKKGEQ